MRMTEAEQQLRAQQQQRVLDRSNVEPSIRTLVTVTLALALLAMSWALAPISNKHGGPAECVYCAEPAWPLP